MLINFKTYKYERSGGIMCKILKELRGKSALELLEKYNISMKPPINIDLLLYKIGISAIPINFNEVETEVGLEANEILGATISNGENLSIFYQDKATNNRKRFTLAHEIAHCCIHSDNLIDHHVELRANITANTTKEYQANIFAGELLIPKRSLLEIYEKLLHPTLDSLAKIFEVSPMVMKARLEYLELPYNNEINTKDN